MCEWTDKYPVGSEHWLYGKVGDTDPGDIHPLLFNDSGYGWVNASSLRLVEEKDHVLEKLIDSLGVDVVLKALEKRIGVPESVHWKTLNVGDTVEIEDEVHRDDADYFKDYDGPFSIVEMEGAGYGGKLPFAIHNSVDAESGWWPHISSIKGVHGDS